MKCLRYTVVVLLLTCGQIPLAYSADQTKFSLATAVSKDHWLYVHGVNNPERAFLNNHWQHVFDAVKEAQLDQEIKKLVMQNISGDEDRQSFEQHWNNAVELFGQVNWGDLVSEEFVYAQRMATFVQDSEMLVVPDHLMLFRGDQSSVQGNVQGLVNVLQQLAQLSEDLNVTQSDHNGIPLWTLGTNGPISINLFHRNDVVGLATSRSGLESAVQLMTGDSGAALVNTPKYKQATSTVPAAEDSVVFCDMSRLMNDIQAIFEKISEHELGSEPAPDDQAVVDAIDAMIKQFDFIDYIVSTEQTTGLQTANHSVTQLTEAGKDNAIVKMLTHQEPIAEIYKYVPKDSTAHWAWSGIDLKTGYDLILDFIKEHVPEGADHVGKWEDKLAEVEFNPDEEIFEWLDGQMISVSMPPAVQTGFGGGADSVLLVRVKDQEKAASKVNSAVDKLNSFLSESPEMGQGLIIAPAADINAEGFRSVTHPMVAMMLRLSYGVHDQWLMIGTSSQAVNKVLATMRGDAPSCLENDRFQKQGIKVNGPVVAASFSDLQNLGQEMAGALGMMQFASAMIPPGPETQVIKSIFAIVGKLAPAVAKIDFYESSSSVCTFEGNRWQSKTITTYREYVPPAVLPARDETPNTEKKRQLDGL